MSAKFYRMENVFEKCRWIGNNDLLGGSSFNHALSSNFMAPERWHSRWSLSWFQFSTTSSHDLRWQNSLQYTPPTERLRLNMESALCTCSRGLGCFWVNIRPWKWWPMHACTPVLYFITNYLNLPEVICTRKEIDSIYRPKPHSCAILVLVRK